MTTACASYYRDSDITTSGALTHRYYVRDYLGSTWAVIDEEGNVLQSTAYYPSGVPLTPNSLTPQTIKLHTGKDFFDLQGAGWYDNQARYYDCLIPTFKSIDPLAEKYPWLSPYNHCANNPLRFVDRDGKELSISGELSDFALNKIQSAVGNRLSLSMNSLGNISYTINSEYDNNTNAQILMNIIDNGDIRVNLITTKSIYTSTGDLFIGGAFMGNMFSNNKVIAFQEINPDVLNDADLATNTPGKMIMHEVSEAYEGALISYETGIAAPPAKDGELNVIYNRAHNNATPQTAIKQAFYNGLNETSDINNATRIVWYVTTPDDVALGLSASFIMTLLDIFSVDLVGAFSKSACKLT